MKTQIPHAEAMRLAQELAAALRPYTTRLEIAGSLRRGKATVGDIELVYVPRFEERQLDLLTTGQWDVADERIGGWLMDGTLAKRPNVKGHFTWGEKNKLALHRDGTPVDLFATTEANWFVSLVIRTGSKETNLKLTTGAIRDGNTLNAYGRGITRADGTVVRAESEEHVFQLCGVPYLKPHQR